MVWTVGYNTNTSGLHPLGHASPMNDLNVGLSPAARVGHDRFPDSIIWDTRSAGFTAGAPFVAGSSSTWTGMPGPATCRLRASPFADENLPHRGGSAGHGCPALMSQATTTHVAPLALGQKPVWYRHGRG